MKRLLSIVGLTAMSVLIPVGAATGSGATTNGVFHPVVPVGSIRHGTVTSSNWSGYAVEGTAKFTGVIGTWVEPAATCTSSGHQYAAFWVGIDGYSSNSVEQLGTDSDCTGPGTPSYYAWWEMYPKASVQLSTTKYPVSAGDTLTAEVSVSGEKFTLSIKSSQGWTFSVVETGSAKLQQASAEWIAESPEICIGSSCSLAKLSDFGKMSFTGSEAATGGPDMPISSFATDSGPHKIVMKTSSGTIRALPSALSGGTKFSVAWKHD